MSEKSEPKPCPKCGGPIPAEAPQGLCPKCLLAQASIPTDAGQGQSMPAPPSQQELAAAFPQLEILELIGQGGMGFVFKARQLKLERLVALKILPQTFSKDPAFAERFTREGRVLARLNHPNIVTIHDFGQANGFFYLLMEYVDGVNLRQAMRAGRFSPEHALAVVPKICDALQFAHNEGILHRDIKPENILLDAKGRLKIADFGIAKLLSEPHSDAKLTASGGTLGTPHYMAPEQIEKPAAVDHRADIYSLGVVFYEMLTGELPLGKFQPPSKKVEVDVRLDDVVLHALEKEPERRYQQVSEVKTAVDTIATVPASIDTSSGGTPTGEPHRRGPVPNRARHLKRGLKVGLLVSLVVTVTAMVITFLLPESYEAVARVNLVALPQPPYDHSYDPYLLQYEMQLIESQPVLERVIAQLKLPERWGSRYDNNTTLKTDETFGLLKSRIDVRPVRNTSTFLQIGSFSERPDEAAEVANTIAEAYQSYRSEQISNSARAGKGDSQSPAEAQFIPRLARVEIVDRAIPPRHPLRPNKPLNIVLGMITGILLGTVAGLLVAVISGIISRSAPREALPRPDRFWRWFAVAVVAMVAVPVALAILAILAAIVIPNFVKARAAREHAQAAAMAMEQLRGRYEQAKGFQLRWVAREEETNSPVDLLPDANDLSGQSKLRVLKEVLLDGAAVESAGFAKFEPDRSEITVLLTDAGGRRFAELTRANSGRRLAIVWNGRVLSAPVIRDAITSRQVMITGNFGYTESQLLVDVLDHRNHALLAKLEEARAQLAEMLTTRKEEHPDVIRQKAKIEALEKQLKAAEEQ